MVQGVREPGGACEQRSSALGTESLEARGGFRRLLQLAQAEWKLQYRGRMDRSPCALVIDKSGVGWGSV